MTPGDGRGARRLADWCQQLGTHGPDVGLCEAQQFLLGEFICSFLKREARVFAFELQSTRSTCLWGFQGPSAPGSTAGISSALAPHGRPCTRCSGCLPGLTCSPLCRRCGAGRGALPVSQSAGHCLPGVPAAHARCLPHTPLRRAFTPPLSPAPEAHSCPPVTSHLLATGLQ